MHTRLVARPAVKFLHRIMGMAGALLASLECRSSCDLLPLVSSEKSEMNGYLSPAS